MSAEQRPSVGRIVHYWGKMNGRPFAAIVVGLQADTDSLWLSVFGLDGKITLAEVSRKPGREHEPQWGGWWEWPPRV